MNRFPGFDNIKLCYEWGCYSKKDLQYFVEIGCLTKSEYKEISGDAYPVN